MSKKQPEYYTIIFEKFIDIMTESDRYYYMVAEEIKSLITENQNVDKWEVSPIPDFMETLVILNSLRTFLDKKINDPTDEEVKYCNQNGIKDVLVTKEELVMLQKFVLALEEQKAFLYREYKFSHLTN